MKATNTRHAMRAHLCLRLCLYMCLFVCVLVSVCLLLCFLFVCVCCCLFCLSVLAGEAAEGPSDQRLHPQLETEQRHRVRLREGPARLFRADLGNVREADRHAQQDVSLPTGLEQLIFDIYMIYTEYIFFLACFSSARQFFFFVRLMYAWY